MADDELYIPRQRDDDEISLISMRELAPSPFEDDEDSAYYADTPTGDDDFDPTTTPMSKSATLQQPSAHTRGLAFWRTPPTPARPIKHTS